MATAVQPAKIVAPKIRIRLRSYDHKMLDDSLVKIVDVVKRTGAVLAGPVLLPVQIKKYTVLRSPHTDKKSREQFEMRIHKRLIDILSPNAKVIEALTNLNLPSGVTIDVKMV